MLLLHGCLLFLESSLTVAAADGRSMRCYQSTGKTWWVATEIELRQVGCEPRG